MVDRLDATNMDVPQPLPPFIERELNGSEPARCVDGRADLESLLGPQMLGGSTHPILLYAISTGRVFNRAFVSEQADKLSGKGFILGAHRGSHKDVEKSISDCGAADRISDILRTTISDREAITHDLNHLYKENRHRLPANFSQSVNAAFDVLANYPAENLQLGGEELVQTLEDHGAVIENVQGSHAEETAYINIKPGITFDTKKSNEDQRQAFNMDIVAAVKETKALGVDEDLALGLSAVLYAAIERVLVQQKGKPALPIVLNS